MARSTVVSKSSIMVETEVVTAVGLDVPSSARKYDGTGGGWPVSTWNSFAHRSAQPNATAHGR